MVFFSITIEKESNFVIIHYNTLLLIMRYFNIATVEIPLVTLSLLTALK